MQRVIGEAGCGLVRMRALTVTKNGEGEFGYRMGNEVLSVRPIVTVGSGDLYGGQSLRRSKGTICKAYGWKNLPFPLPIV